MYPHDALPDDVYTRVGTKLAEAAREDSGVTQTIEDGVSALNVGRPFTELSADEQQLPQRPGQQGGGRGIGGEHQQQDQQRVRHVAAAQQHRDGRDGKHRRGGQAGRRFGEPADRSVQDQHGEHSLDHLRQDQRPDVKAETRRDRACTHSAPGSLSTVTVPAGSNAPKMKSCQLSDMLRAAAP